MGLYSSTPFDPERQRQPDTLPVRAMVLAHGCWEPAVTWAIYFYLRLFSLLAATNGERREVRLLYLVLSFLGEQ